MLMKSYGNGVFKCKTYKCWGHLFYLSIQVDVNQENKDNDGCRGNELVVRREEANDEGYFKVRFLYNRKCYAIISAVTN